MYYALGAYGVCAHYLLNNAEDPKRNQEAVLKAMDWLRRESNSATERLPREALNAPETVRDWVREAQEGELEKPL